MHVSDNSLKRQIGQKFSTPDQDNDVAPSESCAVTYKGAWWYSACHDTNLNGLYLGGVNTQWAAGVVWQHWRGDYYSLKFTEMKIKPYVF